MKKDYSGFVDPFEDTGSRFNDFVDPFAAPPEPEPERGFMENTLRGAGGRAVDLGSNLIDFIGNLSKDGERAFAELTGINPYIRFGDDGISFEMNADPDTTDNVAAYAADQVDKLSDKADYQPNFTWEKLKGDVTPSNLAGYIVEQGVKSVPDMAAALFTLPAYISSRTQEIAEVRVENDEGKEQVDTQELAKSAIPAVAASLLERVGAKGVVSMGGVTGPGSLVKEATKAGLREGATEFAQENIEYAGETVGTDADYDLAQGLDRGFAGAVAGSGFGGGVRAGTGTAELIHNKMKDAGTQVRDAGGDDLDAAIAESEVLNEITPEAFSPPPTMVYPEQFEAPGTVNFEPVQQEVAPDPTTSYLDENNPVAAENSIDFPVFDIDKKASAIEEITGDTDLVARFAQNIADSRVNLESQPVSDDLSSITPEIATEDSTALESVDSRQSNLQRFYDQSILPIGEERDTNPDLETEIERVRTEPDTRMLRKGVELALDAAIKGDTMTDKQKLVVDKLVGKSEPQAQEDIDGQANEAATSPQNDLQEPSDAQKEAGNYKMGHINVQGLDISVENPKGSKRSGTDPDGNKWESDIHQHYGYIRRTEGADGDHVDVFVGDNTQSNKAFIIDQVDKDGAFDEHKVMLGFDDETSAVDGYLMNYEEGWEVGPVSEVTMDEFKGWIENGDTTQAYSVEGQNLQKANDANIESPETEEANQADTEETSEPEVKTNIEDQLDERVFAPTTLKYVKDSGFDGSINDDGSISVFHGTSSKNAKSINSSGKFEGFPFFALDRETAEQFSRQAGGSPEVMEIKVDPDVVIPTGGYMSSRVEGLTLGDDGVFSTETEQPKFYIDEDQEEDLFVVHNLSAENLRHSEEIGGLAAPSLAVGRAEYGMDNFGEISLLAKPDILESHKAKVFDADIYTPRHPRPVYNIDIDAYNQFVRDAGQVHGLRLPDPNEMESRGFDEFMYSDGAKLAYLNSVGKKVVAPKMKVDPIVRKIAAIEGKYFERLKNPKVIKLANQYFDQKKERLMETLMSDGMTEAEALEIADERSGNPERAIEDFLRYTVLGYENTGGVDQGALRERIAAKFRTKKAEREYEAWARKQFESMVESKKLFKGFTPSGNRRYIDYTMDNILKEMNAKLQNGENFNYGAGSVRSVYANRLKNIRAVQKSRDQIVSSEEFQEIKDESQGRLSDLLDELRPYYKYDANGFGYMDDASSAIAEGARGLSEAFDLDQEMRQKVYDFIEYLGALPTEYFEAKLQRQVDISEFHTAVVPKNTDPEVIDILKSKGLKIKKYDSSVEGARREVIAQQKDVLFSDEKADQPAVKRSENQAPARRLNTVMAENFGEEWADAYESVEMPVETAGMQEAIKAAFGREIRPVQHKSDEFNIFSGLYLPQGRNVYVNVRANKGFMHIAGHEIMHDLKQSRPDLYDWFSENASSHIKEFDAYKQRKIDKIDGQGKLTDEDIREELLADFTGDALSDPEFVAKLAEDNPGKFKKLMNWLVGWLKKVGNKVQNLGSDQYFNDINTLREKLRQALNDYAEGKPIAPESKPDKDVVFSEEGGDGGGGRRDDVEYEVDSGDRPIRSGIRDRLDAMRFQVQDKLIDLKRAQEGIETNDDANPYQKASIWEGKAGERLNDFDEGRVQPLLEKVAETGLDLTEIGNWLVARHAREANEYLAEINPDKPSEERNRLSGMSNIEAGRILSRNRDNAALQEVGQMVDMMNRERVDTLVSQGLIEPGVADAWHSRYQHYVPLKREEAQGIDYLPSRGQGFNIKGKESKMRTGSAYWKPAHILSNVIAQIESSIVRAEKNEVGKSLLEFVEQNPNQDWWSIDTERKTNVVRDGRVVEGVKLHESNNEMVVKRNGQEYVIVFNPENERAMRLVTGMKNLQAAQMGTVMRGLASVTRFLASVNTSWNPEFMVSNFFRDLQTAAYNLSDTQIANMRGKVVRDVFKAQNGIRNALFGDGQSEWAQVWEDFRKHGGKTGWLDLHADILQKEQDLEGMVERLKDGKPSRTLLERMLKKVEDANNVIENGVRLAAYKHALDSGLSKDQAAALAKDLTVNFNRKGNIGPQINAFYMFYNAAIQGNVRLLQAMANSSQGRALAMGTIGGAMILDMINRSISGEDDDGENLYDELPDFVKDHNIIIMGEKEPIVKIPSPWGYNVLHTIGQVFGEALTGGERFNALDGASRVGVSIMEAFNPVGSSTVAQTLAPTLADPIVQISENKNFSGIPLKPEHTFDAMTPKPEYQMHFSSAREMSKDLAHLLNDATGGNEERPGEINVSPEWIDLIIDNATGGLGRTVGNSLDVVNRMIQGEEIPTENMPFVRRVTGYNSEYGVKSRYYEWSRDVSYAKSERKHLRGEDREEALEKPQQKLVMLYNATEKRLRKLRKQRREMEKNSADKAQIEKIDQRIRETMSRFNRAYVETMFN